MLISDNVVRWLSGGGLVAKYRSLVLIFQVLALRPSRPGESGTQLVALPLQIPVSTAVVAAASRLVHPLSSALG